MKKEENGFIVKYTTKDVIEKIDDNHKELMEKIGAIQRKTNKALIISSTALTLTLIVLTVLIEHLRVK